MRPSILHLDDKLRLSIPASDQSTFPGKIVHCSLRTHSILVGPLPYHELGSYSNKMDSTGRIMIGKDLLAILGVGEQDQKKDQVLWIPNKIRDRTTFLLFFGAIGQQTWKQMLATKTMVHQLALK